MYLKPKLRAISWPLLLRSWLSERRGSKNEAVYDCPCLLFFLCRKSTVCYSSEGCDLVPVEVAVSDPAALAEYHGFMRRADTHRTLPSLDARFPTI